jgi:3',5'-cyclic AMP phosphodiesterase CpdA
MTPSESDRSTVIAAVGDGPDGGPGAAAVGELIGTWDPSLLVYLGDVYDDGLPDEFDNWYEAALGPLYGITMPVLGNHELEHGEAKGYFSYWGDPPQYYAADAGDWRVIVLDSSSSANQLMPGSTQYEWLAGELAAHANNCTIVSLHHPAFSIGPNGDTEQLRAVWELIAENGVEIVLAGHDHDYQRWEPLDAAGMPSSVGTTQFVVGTGGHGIRPFVRSDERVEAGMDETGVYGALRLDLHAKSADFAFITTGGQSLDAGSIPCNSVDE